MKRESTALQLELARVREQKRNTESALELVRSDNEKGKLHIRVNSDPEYRKELAEAIVWEAFVSESKKWYTNPVKGLLTICNPSMGISFGDIGFPKISVRDCIPNGESYRWRFEYKEFPQLEEIINKYCETYPDQGEFEWSELPDAIAWAKDIGGWSEELEEWETQQELIQIEFIKSQILDEIIIDVTE